MCSCVGIVRLAGCENFTSELEEFIFNAFDNFEPMHKYKDCIVLYLM